MRGDRARSPAPRLNLSTRCGRSLQPHTVRPEHSFFPKLEKGEELEGGCRPRGGSAPRPEAQSAAGLSQSPCEVCAWGPSGGSREHRMAPHRCFSSLSCRRLLGDALGSMSAFSGCPPFSSPLTRAFGALNNSLFGQRVYSSRTWRFLAESWLWSSWKHAERSGRVGTENAAPSLPGRPRRVEQLPPPIPQQIHVYPSDRP